MFSGFDVRIYSYIEDLFLYEFLLHILSISLNPWTAPLNLFTIDRLVKGWLHLKYTGDQNLCLKIQKKYKRD